MKKASFIIVLLFAVSLIVSSCSREACPAYSSQDDIEFDSQG